MASGRRTGASGPTTHSGTLLKTIGQASALVLLALKTESRKLAGMGMVVAADAEDVRRGSGSGASSRTSASATVAPPGGGQRQAGSSALDQRQWRRGWRRARRADKA